MSFRRLSLLLCGLGLLFNLDIVDSLRAAPNTQQRAEIDRLKAEIAGAVSKIKDGDFEQALRIITPIQRDFDRLDKQLVGSDPETQAAIKPVVRGLAVVRSRLEFEGLTIPRSGDAGPAPSVPNRGTTLNKLVSFRNDVAPLLVQKCGSCHVNQEKGDFSMRSFSELIDSGMVDAGDSQGSRLLEMIRTGDMPRGGGSVSASDLERLAAWVDQGAKFDGKSASTNLRDLGGASRPGLPAARGELRFSTHVAPILVANCTGCHGQNNPRAGFGLNTFTRLMRGGDSGKVIVPGNAATSLLVMKIKGTAAEGQRMPLGMTPLPPEQISVIEKWIAGGAKFDGPNQNQELEQVAALGIAQNSTHEELSQQRVDIASNHWRLAMPDDRSAELESENFLLMGNVSNAELEKLKNIAEQQATKIQSLLNLPVDQPLVKGRITLYAFKQRFDYSEFGTMVEKRRLPRELRGHWRYTIVDAYAAIVPPADERQVSLESLLAEQIAGVTLATKTTAPPWFSTGTARVIASRLDPEDPRIKEWKERVPAILARVTNVDEFLKETLPAADQAVLSFHVVSRMMRDAGRYRSLMSELRKGAEFEAAVAKAYGAPVKSIAEGHLRAGGRR